MFLSNQSVVVVTNESLLLLGITTTHQIAPVDDDHFKYNTYEITQIIQL